MDKPQTLKAAFTGVGLHVVPAGTTIEHEGQTLMVDHNRIVWRGNDAFMVQEDYDRLKQKFPIKEFN